MYSEGEGITYTNDEYQEIYRRYDKAAKSPSSLQKGRGFIQNIFGGWAEEIRELSEVLSTSSDEMISIDQNWGQAILYTFQDAYSKMGRGTINEEGKPVGRCPELVRILVTGILDDQTKMVIRKNIVRVVKESLDQLGIPTVPVFISDDNHNIKATKPAIHIGIDYERIELMVQDKKLQTPGTVRTSRG
jgi:hypothetical protein